MRLPQPIQRPTNELTWENRKVQVPKIKVGDPVWIGELRYPCIRGIKTVTRLTNTLVLVGEGKHSFERFRRDTGYQVGSASFANYISGIATEDEVWKYETEQKNKKAEEERRTSERQALENLNLELNALFADGTMCVRTEHRNKDTEPLRFGVTISGLDETQVRDLAPKLRRLVGKQRLKAEGKI